MLLAFSHLPHYPQGMGPFWCWFPGGWVCVHSRIPWVPQSDSPVRLGVSPCHNAHRFLQLEVLRLYFSMLEPWVCLTPWLFLPVYSCASVGPPSPPAAALPRSSPPCLPVSSPPTSPYECFFFNSLVGGLPYTLSFWQFGLFFCLFLNLLLSFFSLCEETKCYLPTPPSWPEFQPSWNTSGLLILSDNSRQMDSYSWCLKNTY